jgi:hypothetical protein
MTAIPTAADVLTNVGIASSQPTTILIGAARAGGASRARLVAIYLLSTDAQLNGSEIARIFIRTRQWASLLLKAAVAAIRTDVDAVAACRRARHLIRARIRNRAYRARRFAKRRCHFLPGLSDARRQAQLTKAELAARSGVPPETLSRLEALQRRARPETVRSIASALALPAFALLQAAPESLKHIAGQDAPAVRRPKPQPASRVCTDCRLDKSRAEFVPVAGTPYVYGHCRACRAQRARQRIGQAHSFVKPNGRGAGVLKRGRTWRDDHCLITNACISRVISDQRRARSASECGQAAESCTSNMRPGETTPKHHRTARMPSAVRRD